MDEFGANETWEKIIHQWTQKSLGTPLAFWKSDEHFLEGRDGMLCWCCNLGTQEIKEPPVERPRPRRSSFVVINTTSLFSVKGGNELHIYYLTNESTALI